MEVTRDQYARIEDDAHELHEQITRLMDSIERENGRLPAAWHELYNLMSLTGVISDTAGRYRARAELPADPIDLIPAAPVPWPWAEGEGLEGAAG